MTTEIIIIDVFSYMEQVQQRRKYLLRPQKMCRCIRSSANAYWETLEEHQERGEPIATEQVANFALVEMVPYQGNCEFFETRADVDGFFRQLRAKVVEVREATSDDMQMA